MIGLSTLPDLLYVYSGEAISLKVVLSHDLSEIRTAV